MELAIRVFGNDRDETRSVEMSPAKLDGDGRNPGLLFLGDISDIRQDARIGEHSAEKRMEVDH